ncbi:MAG: NACHT domain-containing protein, partial [Anaerolineales bacterium]
WYDLDENAKPPEYRLQVRKIGSSYESDSAWWPVETRLHSILARASTELGFPPRELIPYTASATKQEIVAGALQVDEANEHVFCFLRKIKDFPGEFRAQDFLNLVNANLQKNYADQPQKTIFEGYLDEISQLGPDSTAKDFDAKLRSLMDKAPSASLEADCLDQLKGWLVAFTGRDFRNLDEDWIPDREAHSSQEQLKMDLEEHVPDNTFKYEAQWTGDGITRDHIDQLCEEVYDSLSGVILAEVEKSPHTLLPGEKKILIRADEFLGDEGLAHHAFAEERLQHFIGRTEILGKIAAYLQGDNPRVMGIFGTGGTGKSALTAKAIQQTQGTHPGSQIVYRFIGVTPGSSDGRNLLDSLCREISRRYGADESDVPLDYRELVPEFGNRLALASPDLPLIVFLDSLDQLSRQGDVRNLIWLPDQLPDHVSIIATTRPEDTFEKLKSKPAVLEQLGGLTEGEGKQLLNDWLGDAGRTLQELQERAVLDAFMDQKSGGAPLYLKLAFEEARLWVS